MTEDQLYEHITQHMTPEYALRKFIQGAMIQYEKLKFDGGEEVHPLMIMTMAAWDMGWDFILESDQEDVRGILTGTEAYIETWKEKL